MALAHRRSAPFSMPIFLFAAWLLQLRALRSEQSWYRLRGPSAPRGCPGPWTISCGGVGGRRQHRVGLRVLLLGPAPEPDHFQQFLRSGGGEIAKAAAFIRPKGWEQMPAEF